MRKELEQQLFAKAPKFFRSKDYGCTTADSPNALIRMGLSVGDGWCDLLERASLKIEGLILHLSDAEAPYAFQVKEKFGGLRIYIHNPPVDTALNEQLRAAIDEAEDEASQTCETCGKPGKLQRGKFLQVSCDEHK